VSITAFCCNCIIMSFTSTYLMLLLRRHYTEKKQLFAHMKAIAGETKKKGIASANDLLNDAARVRDYPGCGSSPEKKRHDCIRCL
jgi:hypothetical protein